jgi:hypothetical protein
VHPPQKPTFVENVRNATRDPSPVRSAIHAFSGRGRSRRTRPSSPTTARPSGCGRGVGVAVCVAVLSDDAWVLLSEPCVHATPIVMISAKTVAPRARCRTSSADRHPIEDLLGHDEEAVEEPSA